MILCVQTHLNNNNMFKLSSTNYKFANTDIFQYKGFGHNITINDEI